MVSPSSSTNQDVKFRTKYISNQTLVHYLLAVEFNMNRGVDLDSVNWDT